jgi:hypothetical protein
MVSGHEQESPIDAVTEPHNVTRQQGGLLDGAAGDAGRVDLGPLVGVIHRPPHEPGTDGVGIRIGDHRGQSRPARHVAGPRADRQRLRATRDAVHRQVGRPQRRPVVVEGDPDRRIVSTAIMRVGLLCVGHPQHECRGRPVGGQRLPECRRGVPAEPRRRTSRLGGGPGQLGPFHRLTCPGRPACRIGQPDFGFPGRAAVVDRCLGRQEERGQNVSATERGDVHGDVGLAHMSDAGRVDVRTDRQPALRLAETGVRRGGIDVVPRHGRDGGQRGRRRRRCHADAGNQSGGQGNTGRSA